MTNKKLFKKPSKIKSKPAKRIRLPKILLDVKGNKYITIEGKRYYPHFPSLKKSGLTERELILKLVEHLTKKKKRKTRVAKQENNLLPTVQQGIPIPSIALSKQPPAMIADPAVREYFKIVNLSEASTQRKLDEEKYAKESKKDDNSRRSKASAGEKKSNRMIGEIKYQGKEAQIEYDPEDAGLISDFIKETENKASKKGEMKGIESAAEKLALESWTKKFQGAKINKIRSLLNDEMKKVGGVSYAKIQKMKAPEIYHKILSLPDTDLYRRTQNAFEAAKKEELKKIVQKVEDEAALVVDVYEEESGADDEEDDSSRAGDEDEKYNLRSPLLSPNTIINNIVHTIEDIGETPPSEGIQQQALGKNRIPRSGLSTDDINKLMSHRRSFLGVVPRDYISKLKDFIIPGRKTAFIVNLDPHNKPGLHWVAVVLLPKQARVLYFDSFGKPCPEDMRKQIKKLIKVSMPGEIPIFKENLIKVQRANSVNCGPFAMKFIENTLDGVPFIKATPYDDSLSGEKKIRKYIANLPKFSKI